MTSSAQPILIRRHWRKLLLALVVALIVASPFLYVFATAALAGFREWRSRQPFDAEVWKTSLAGDIDEPIRLRMIDDLLRHHQLRGLNRQEVVSLLGTPPKTNYFRDYDLVYWLGPERGFISIDSEWLAIKFGEDGRVEEASLVRD